MTIKLNDQFTNKFKDITNIEIHNKSTYNLSLHEQIVLGLGVKFLPVPKITKLALKNTIYEQIDNFKDRLRLNLYFNNTTFTPNSIPKNNTKIKWKPQLIPLDDKITSYITSIKQKTSSLIDNTKLIYDNTDLKMHNILNKLSKNTHITIKPADKNLGIVIMDTTDYINMCQIHLKDINTYKIITDYQPSIIYEKLIGILRRYNNLTVNKSYKKTALAESLLQLMNHSTLRIPNFYCLPKIHKDKIPIPGRPIISSINSITYHTSIYLDKELQPTLKLINVICTSSRKIILDMENFMTTPNSVIMCADVTSLYPNIPIQLGVLTVTKVLEELHYFTPSHLKFLMALLTWVLTENYCTFNNITYHQLQGTAMGTPTAVTYANLFLYGIEKTLITKHKPLYYKRYIDDVYSIFNNTLTANNYITDFNNLIPSITFEAVTIGRTGIILDLVCTLETTIDEDLTYDSVTITLYQKPHNIYQYIPTLSQHKQAIFKNFILQELKRYQISCTNNVDFLNIVLQFKERLIKRGYNESLLTHALLQLPTRIQQLTDLQNKSKINNNTTNTLNSPIILLCLPKISTKISWKNTFKLPPEIIENENYKKLYSSPDILVGNINPRTIGSFIVKSKLVDK